MKASDFRREHFANGRRFSQADFDAYIRASEKMTRTAFAAYLPSVGGGILIGLLLSNGVGGFVGNILAVVSIFAGLIVGGVFNIKASRAVNAAANRLGVTKEDVAAARTHVKNGTVAWEGEAADAAIPADAPVYQANFCADCGAKLRENARFCPACGARVPVRESAPGPIPGETVAPACPADADVPRVPALPENPMRAVWVAVGLAITFFLFLLVQSLVTQNRLTFNSNALYLILAALTGTASYLMAKRSLKYRLLGGGTALVTVFLSFWLTCVLRTQVMYSMEVRLAEIFRALGQINAPYALRMIGSALLVVGLPVGAALFVSFLCKKSDEKRGTRLAGWAASGAYFAYCLISTFTDRTLYMGTRIIVNICTSLSCIVFESACVLLVFLAVNALCNMKSKRVRLHGLGLVWCWIAVIGMGASLVSVLIAACGGLPESRLYTDQLFLAASVFTGYILLLSKRRAGLYWILIGGGMMLGAQTLAALIGLFYQPSYYGAQLASSVLGGLNPLFAALAVKASYDGAQPAKPAPVQREKKKVTGFQKTAAIISILSCPFGILFPLLTFLGGERYSGGMLVYALIGLALAIPGVVLLIKQRSDRCRYGKGARVVGVNAFILCLLFLLISVAGSIVFVVTELL